MARMYPATPYPETQRGELLVYQELQKLPDDWVVIHGASEHYIDTKSYVTYEADFIVLIPYLGYVVIEVKDWKRAKIIDGRWCTNPDAATDTWISMEEKKSPLQQAFLAGKKLAHSLTIRGIISEKKNQQPERRSMAIITSCVPSHLEDVPEDTTISNRNKLPLDSLYICGIDELHNNLQERIERLFVKQVKLGPYMTPNVIEAITYYMMPRIIFRQDLNSSLALMELAGNDHLRLLHMLHNSKGGIRVEGCAGSGKTEMVIHEVRRLSTTLPPGSPILLLCYNHHLARFLHQATQDEQASVVPIVEAFHQYCIDYIIKPAGRDDLISYDNNTQYLTDEAWLELEHSALPMPCYDYIFVDEAQDFKKPWWNLIRRMLSPQGKLYIFSDINQDIYQHANALPELPTQLTLRRNLRNVREIAQFCAAMLPMESSIEMPDMYGEAIQIAAGSDNPQERAAYVEAFIKQLLHHPKLTVRPKDIVVLSPWRHTNARCCFPYTTMLDYATCTENTTESSIRYRRHANDDCSTIFANSIKAFKGMEAPFVILTDIIGEGESIGFTINDLYTACSRAKYGLYIVPSVSGAALIKKIREKEQN